MSGRLSKKAFEVVGITPGAARAVGVLAASAILLTGTVPGIATAKTTASVAASAACRVVPGSVTAGGDETGLIVTATSPPTVQQTTNSTDIYPDGQVRLSGTMANDPDIPGSGGRIWGN